ncbi:Sds3-like-domain-containing protein [Kockiozyma suomiensis]|uniref:Sds3-like-domain-containing protein n=1 Tax=Kockiozyma suomiensis TaxID=1337062 RepID=UPI003343D845
MSAITNPEKTTTESAAQPAASNGRSGSATSSAAIPSALSAAPDNADENPEEAETEIEGENGKGEKSNGDLVNDARALVDADDDRSEDAGLPAATLAATLAAAAVANHDAEVAAVESMMFLGHDEASAGQGLGGTDEKEDGEIDSSDDLSAPPTLDESLKEDEDEDEDEDDDDEEEDDDDEDDEDEGDEDEEGEEGEEEEEENEQVEAEGDSEKVKEEKAVAAKVSSLKVLNTRRSLPTEKEDEEEDEEDEEDDEDEEEKMDVDEETTTAATAKHAKAEEEDSVEEKKAKDDNEMAVDEEEANFADTAAADDEADADEEAEDEEGETSPSKRKYKLEEDADNEERAQKRQAAVASLTEIEVEFAKLRDRLHEDRIVRLSAEIELCLQGRHPELSAVYEQIARARDERIRLAETHRRYRRRCIENQTRSYRSHWHQQFCKNVANLRAKMMSETTETWYRINRERRAMDAMVPFYGYRLSDKRAALVRQRQAQYQEVAILTGLSKYVGFPAAPDIKSASADEIAEDLEALRGLKFAPM